MFGVRPSREQVYSALFALSEGVQWNVGTADEPEMKGFMERTREIKLFSDVSTECQPWFGQAEHGESSTQKTGLPYKRVWGVDWIVYHKGPSPRAIWNNLIIDALETALAPKPTDPGFFEERNTLSGLVVHCFIEGEIFKDPGDIDGQAMIVIPIKVLVP